MIWLLPHPLLPTIPSASCLSFSVFLCGAGRVYWLGGMGWDGRGAKSYDGEKAWSSINHSILSAIIGNCIAWAGWWESYHLWEGIQRVQGAKRAEKHGLEPVLRIRISRIHTYVFRPPESGSNRQRYGSADPDLYQYVMDLQHWLEQICNKHRIELGECTK